MPKALAHFTISKAGDQYLLRIEDENGDARELTASFDQLDLVAEAVDAQLDRDEDDALGVDEEGAA